MNYLTSFLNILSKFVFSDYGLLLFFLFFILPSGLILVGKVLRFLVQPPRRNIIKDDFSIIESDSDYFDSAKYADPWDIPDKRF